MNEALKLSPFEKIAVIDSLMASFDISQRQRVDEAWAQEVERRIDAYDAGTVSARPAEDIMKEINS